MGIREGIITDSQVIKEAEDFIDEYCHHHDFSQRITIEDIQKANTVIKRALGLGEEESNT